MEQKRLEKWDGKYPVYFMGLGGDDADVPDILIPSPDPATAEAAPSRVSTIRAA